jgi:flavodoxin
LSKQPLISYYSRSGNTLIIAELIRKEVSGILHEIRPEKPYPPDNGVVVEQAKKEIRKGYKPPLKSTIENIAMYELLFVGSPIWWGTMAPPVLTFLSDNDFTGKTILPFCTHGGGGSGQYEEDIASHCPHSKILSGLSIYRRDMEKAQSEVASWLKKLELL